MVGSGRCSHFLGALFKAGASGGLTDAELLERFVSRTAPAELAFAVLVERHGPLVDAFAGASCAMSMRPKMRSVDFPGPGEESRVAAVRATLGPWLHAVAYRVACEARSIAARRFKHERRVAEMATQEEGSEGPREDRERHLHEEIQKLAERHRRPIGVCDLKGLTHEQAAQCWARRWEQSRAGSLVNT